MICFLIIALTGCAEEEGKKPESAQIQILGKNEEQKQEIISDYEEEVVKETEEESAIEREIQEDLDDLEEGSRQEWWMEKPDCIINTKQERPFKPASDEIQPERGVEYVQPQDHLNSSDELVLYVGDIFEEIGESPEAVEKYIYVLTKESVDLIQATEWDSLNPEEMYEVNRVWLDVDMHEDYCSGGASVELLGTKKCVRNEKEIYCNVYWFWDIAYDYEVETGIINIRATNLEEIKG